MRGREFVDELCGRFSHLPRSIVVKTDVLREGVRYSPELEEAGSSSLPFFLLWNPAHTENPRANDESLLMVPWKFQFTDGTPVKIVVEEKSPYQIRKNGGSDYVLCRDGDEIAETVFEKMPSWYMTTTSDGRLLPTVIQLFSCNCLFGCILRYCEYARTKQQCRYCSLDSTIEDFGKRGFEYSISASPEHWAEGLGRALEHGPVRHVSLTGGSLLDAHKEALHYSRILSTLSTVREKTGSQALFEVCLSAMSEGDHKLLKSSGLDVLAHHMDTWEERLWPEIVPGKASHVGRERCLASLEQAVEVFGWGNVQSNFVIGVETACADGIRDAEEGADSWRACFSTLLEKGILPRTTVWQSTEGAAYYGRPRPATDYLLRIAYERYLLIQKSGIHGRGLAYPCSRCNSWSCDLDFPRLLEECHCSQCA